MIRPLMVSALLGGVFAAPTGAETQSRLLTLWTRYLEVCAPLLKDPATPFAQIANADATPPPVAWTTADGGFRMYEWIAPEYDKTEYIEVIRQTDGLHLTCLVTDDKQPGDDHTDLAGAFIALASHSADLEVTGGEMAAELSGQGLDVDAYGAPHAYLIDGAFGPGPIRTLFMIRSGGMMLQVQQPPGAL